MTTRSTPITALIMMGMIILLVVLTKRKNSPDRRTGKMKFFQVSPSLGRFLSSGMVGSQLLGERGTFPQVWAVGLAPAQAPQQADFPRLPVRSVHDLFSPVRGHSNSGMPLSHQTSDGLLRPPGAPGEGELNARHANG